MNSKYENLKTIMDSGMVLIIRTDSEDEAFDRLYHIMRLKI